jgi:transcription antitermination factor NusG
MLKESENPPISWPAEMAITDFTGRWWVAHTRSRNEKALAWDNLNKNISYFLPMNWKVRRTRGRTVRSLLPLFSGYLFFCGDERDRLEVLRTNRVAHVLEVKDQDKLVDELSQIERAISAGVSLRPHKYLKAGQHCRVIGGPLADLQGIIVTTRDDTRLVLQIDMLGQATSLEIDIESVEPIEE